MVEKEVRVLGPVGGVMLFENWVLEETMGCHFGSELLAHIVNPARYGS
jgi:hypothetical protein